jgi:hypothetical protein
MNDEVSTPSKLGIIAGNGRFPFSVFDAARERVAHALTSLVAGWDENHNRVCIQPLLLSNQFKQAFFFGLTHLLHL